MSSSEIDKKTNLARNNQLELLCFRLIPDGVMFAVNVFKVRETVRFAELTELPSSDPSIDGLLTLRDSIIPIVDLKKWLYSQNVPAKLAQKDKEVKNSDRQIIVCEFNEVLVGIKVFKADYILRKNWEEIMVPVTNDYGNKINNYTKNEKNDIVHIVDVEQMLSDIFPEINDEIENNIQNIATFSFDKEKLILVAEDSVVASKALEKILTKIGARHKMFVNGQLLLDYVNSLNEYDGIGLVITDLEMPVASGFTVIKELKRNPKTQKIPIVVNSSMSGKSNVDMAKSLNADGFMAKTKPNEIAEFVRKFLGN